MRAGGAPPSGETVWTFSAPHAAELRDAARSAGLPVTISLVASRALDVRLQSLTQSASRADVPALVEIEIGSVGKYFSGSLADVPFVPLTDRLKRSGWLGRLSPARLTAWSKDGEVFGVPLDVHPVSLTYRKDLFDAADIDLTNATTWSDLHDRCLLFESFERSQGRRTRAMQLPSGSADVIAMMLQQRGVNPVDSNNHPQLTDPRVASTITQYARMVAGPRKISADASPGPGRWADDLERGDVAAVLTPDWAVDDLRRHAPQLAGKLAMCRLPVFDRSDHPTASWGGTMVAIPRAHPNPDDAWTLLKRLYLSNIAREARTSSNVLPAVIDWWDEPARLNPDPLFAGQAIGAAYGALARQLPTRVVTPFTATATSAMSLVLYRATAAIEQGNDQNLEALIASWLVEADADLQRRIAFANLGR